MTSTTTIRTIVVRGTDASPTPITGLVLGQEDEDRVVVAWGDTVFADDPASEARVEWIDDLRAVRGRL